MPRIGSHISLSRYIDFTKAVDDIVKHKGNVIQIFMSNPRKGSTKNKQNSTLVKMKEYLKKKDVHAFIHSSYVVNLAKDWDEYSWWIKTLQLEFEYAHTIGAKGIIVHLGKQLNLSIEQCYNNMLTSIAYIINSTNHTNVDLLIETSSGQGTETCYKLEDFAYFFRKLKLIKSKRIGICIDTCHIFSAGYEIRNKKMLQYYLDTFEELIGLRYVKLIHLNDSKVELGSRVDRHELIGKGKIGFKPLKRFFDYFAKINVPIILETPEQGFKYEIQKLI